MNEIISGINSSLPILAINKKALMCPKCGSTKTQKRGTRVVSTGLKQEFVCKRCGCWSHIRIKGRPKQKKRLKVHKKALIGWTDKEWQLHRMGSGDIWHSTIGKRWLGWANGEAKVRIMIEEIE